MSTLRLSNPPPLLDLTPKPEPKPQAPKPQSQKPIVLKLSAKALKVTVVLDPAALVDIVVPDGKAQFPLVVEVNGKGFDAPLNPKSFRRCVNNVKTGGPENFAVVLTGKLVGNVITEAGIAAQPKAPKPADEKAPEANAA